MTLFILVDHYECFGNQTYYSLYLFFASCDAVRARISQAV
jgi:hypothetical protein